MLSARHRMTGADEFRRTMRGRRAGGKYLVVHTQPGEPTDPADPNAPARVGFVVSKAVGVAVVRNLVKRRLRHLMRTHLTGLPPGTSVVVRALPTSSTASYDDLSQDLNAALARATVAKAGGG